jgi:hypothetical protein
MKHRNYIVDCPLLKRLRTFDRWLRKQKLDLIFPGLNTLGLIFDKHLDDGRYDTFTPANCITFAHTGGDGTHFGMLQDDARLTDKSPIVLMVPCSGYYTAIIGEGLLDFLSLGCIRGYFCLEQLAYDYDETVKEYTNPHWQPPAEDRRDDSQKALSLLKAEFDLKPWTDPKRFEYLQARYHHLLDEPIVSIHDWPFQSKGTVD